MQDQVFGWDGAFVRQWVGLGQLPGQFNCPIGVAAKGNEVIVTDCTNHRVQVFGLDGTFVRQWGGKGDGPGQFNQPFGVAVVEGEVIVCDAVNHRVQVFE